MELSEIAGERAFRMGKPVPNLLLQVGQFLQCAAVCCCTESGSDVSCHKHKGHEVSLGFKEPERSAVTGANLQFDRELVKIVVTLQFNNAF